MTSLHSKGFLLLLLLNAFLPLVVPQTSWRVTVRDDSSTTKLTATCKSNGVLVGTRTINPGVRLSFDNKLISGGRTLATCDLTLGNLRGNFVLFDTDRNDRNRCTIGNECFWSVSESGIFLSADAKVALHFSWP